MKKRERLWPDWGNTVRAAMAGLGFIGLIKNKVGRFCIDFIA